jgi:hypothetical protein
MGLGSVQVRGRSLVPSPPAIITAFIKTPPKEFYDTLLLPQGDVYNRNFCFSIVKDAL